MCCALFSGCHWILISTHSIGWGCLKIKEETKKRQQRSMPIVDVSFHLNLLECRCFFRLNLHKSLNFNLKVCIYYAVYGCMGTILTFRPINCYVKMKMKTKRKEKTTHTNTHTTKQHKISISLTITVCEIAKTNRKCVNLIFRNWFIRHPDTQMRYSQNKSGLIEKSIWHLVSLYAIS